jgi:hypothetical protein
MLDILLLKPYNSILQEVMLSILSTENNISLDNSRANQQLCPREEKGAKIYLRK